MKNGSNDSLLMLPQQLLKLLAGRRISFLGDSTVLQQYLMLSCLLRSHADLQLSHEWWDGTRNYSRFSRIGFHTDAGPVLATMAFVTGTSTDHRVQGESCAAHSEVPDRNPTRTSARVCSHRIRR